MATGVPGFPPLNETKGRASIDERNCGTTMTSSTTSQYDVTGREGGRGWWEDGLERVASSCARGRTVVVGDEVSRMIVC